MTRAPFDPSRIRPPEEPKTETSKLLTVSQLTALVQRAIQSALPATIHVVGEISNIKRHSSGHLYLTLKDAGAELSCVLWRSDAAKLKFTPCDGLEVVATGGVEVFERAGRYQLYIRRMEPRGVGALELAFRQLYQMLAKEGLFDAARKRPLPRFPRRIALVTSPTGAAVADMIRTIERRFPCVAVLVHPVKVQGPGAADEIAAAVRALNANSVALGGIDVMIVGRGGGSLEDLWAFNEEPVARAIFASPIPVVSAVGHEVDVTIADLVADVRAATPTAAAELVVPVLEDVVAELAALERRVRRSAENRFQFSASCFAGLLKRSPLLEPALKIRRREQLVDEFAHRLGRGFVTRLHAIRRRLDVCESAVQRIAPHVFLRGTARRLERIESRLNAGLSLRLRLGEREWSRICLRLFARSPEAELRRLTDRVEGLARRVPVGIQLRFTRLTEMVESRKSLLSAVSHESVLARGFSITRVKKSGAAIKSVAGLRDGQRLVTQVADGEFESQTVNVHQRELFDETCPREN